MLPIFNAADPDPERIRNLSHHLSSVIHSELDGEMFFHIESERLEYWAPAWLMDQPIRRYFPKAHEEIQGAGRCYGYGEPTACVFHLMRVIDSGRSTLCCKYSR